jgi:hypothetical protein
MVAAVLCVADRLLVLPRTVGSAGGRVGLLLRVWPARVLTGAFCCVVAVCLLCPLRADVGANDLLVQIGDLLEQFLERAMLLDPFLNFLKHIHGDVQALGLSSYLLANSERTMFVTACAATVGLTQVTPTFVSVPCSVGPKEANLLTLASRLACRPRWRVLIPWLHLCGSGVLNTAFLLNCLYTLTICTLFSPLREGKNKLANRPQKGHSHARISARSYPIPRSCINFSLIAPGELSAAHCARRFARQIAAVLLCRCRKLGRRLRQ